MASNFAIGIPNILNPIPSISSVPGILAIPNISRILNVPTIAAMQSIPGILGIVKAVSIGEIPKLPGIGALLNVSSLGSLVRISGVSNLLNFDALTGGLMKGDGLGAKKRATDKGFWGILPSLSNPDGTVLQADSVFSFDFKNGTRISTFPQEKGAFQSYNKVQSPFESRLIFTRGGTESDRAAFLQAIDDISSSLNLYDIVTPERVYHDANVYSYNLIRRAAGGIGLISVEVLFEEVRVTAVTQFSGGDSPAVIVDPAAADSAQFINSGNLLSQIQSTVGKKVAGIVGIPSIPSAFSAIRLGDINGVVMSANNAGAVVGRVLRRP